MAVLGLDAATLTLGTMVLLYLSTRNGVGAVTRRPILYLYGAWLLLEMGVSVSGFASGLRAVLGVIT